jgi:PAS domain S-box-containing protein
MDEQDPRISGSDHRLANPGVAASRFLRGAWCYGLALLLVTLALLTRWVLVRTVGELPTYIVFYPAVMLVAILAGLGPGLFATLLAALAADYYCIRPYGSFAIASVADAVGLGLFTGMGAFMSGVAELYRRSRQRVAAYEKAMAVREQQARAAEAIRRQKDLLAVTLSSIGDGVIVTDAQGCVTSLNGEAERLTGWKNDEARGQPLTSVFRIVNEETRQAVESPVDKVLRLGTVVDLANHTLLVAKDGREIPIDDSGAPIREPGGTLHGVVLVFRDFTARKLAEQALTRLAAIVESSDDAIVSKDLGGIIRTWNVGAERLFGYRAEEVVGQPIARLLPPQRIGEEEQIMARLRSGQCVERLETVRLAKDGRPIDVSVTISPLKDCEGRVIGASKIARDISQRKQAQEAVLRAKEEWERTFHSVPDLIAILDENHRVVRVNRPMANRLGQEPEQCVGLRCFEAVHGTQCQPAFCPHSRTLADGKEHTAEVYEELLGGHFLVSTTPLLARDGSLFGSVHVARDITERKQKEKQLEQLNRTLRALSNSNQALMRADDEAAYLRDVCKIVTEDCGHAMVWIGLAENDEARSIRPVAHAGFDDGYLETLQLSWADSERGRGPTGMAIRTGQVCVCRDMQTDPDFLPWRDEAVRRGYTSSLALPLASAGRPFGALTIYSRQSDPFSADELRLLRELADDLAYGVSILRLRQAHARAEAEVHRQREWLRVTLSSIGDAVLATDTAACVTFLNPIAAALTGWTADEALGQPVARIFQTVQEGSRQTAADVVAQVLDCKRVVALANHTALVTKDGGEVPIEDSAAPILDAAGDVTGVVLVFHDVTEKRRAQEALQASEERLRRLAETAQAANVAKSQFLANMSHELRTPMNAILGMIDLVLGESLPPAACDHLQTAREAADTLLELLNEILDLSRIEAGRFDLEAVPFSLRKTVEQVVKILDVRASEKGLDLICDLPADVPDALVGDPLRLRQVLVNLVGNAIKFTPKGEIRLRAAIGVRESQRVSLAFSVADTGIGISPEDRQRIFAPFTQADASTTRRYGGTGLGLTISQKLVELMGGRIWVESQSGRGSTFHFTAQLALGIDGQPGPEAPRATAPLAQPTRPLRVLLAEDTRANQKLVTYVLTKRGHHVEIAADGEQALDLVEQQEFDVVLMDVQMPRMDGFQVTAAIRKLPVPAKARLPIIAMTAHALKGDEERCLAAGMDSYLSKPINSRELTELVERLGRAAP